MLPCIHSVIDHRGRQNVVRTWVTHSVIALCATFWFLPHFDVICDLLLNRRAATWNLFVKLKFQKHGFPRSRNTRTGKLWKSGPLWEQPTGTAKVEMNQSQLLKTSQSQQSIVLYKVSRNQSTSSPDEHYHYADRILQFLS